MSTEAKPQVRVRDLSTAQIVSAIEACEKRALSAHAAGDLAEYGRQSRSLAVLHGALYARPDWQQAI